MTNNFFLCDLGAKKWLELMDGMKITNHQSSINNRTGNRIKNVVFDMILEFILLTQWHGRIRVIMSSQWQSFWSWIVVDQFFFSEKQNEKNKVKKINLDLIFVTFEIMT